MNQLEEFQRMIKERLATTCHEPHWEPDAARAFMSAIDRRRQRCEELARCLADDVIRPRLEALAAFFPLASMARKETNGRCTCSFGYCQRFPASTQVCFAVDHDVRCENIAVHYQAHMMPTFIKLDEHDKLTQPLDEANETIVGEWVEKRLLEFLDAYLSIDRGLDEFEQDTATDPVCGMRITRSGTTVTADHYGHLYYFCSSGCKDKFSANPAQFVRVKAM